MTTDPKQPEAQEAPASAWDERMQFEKWAKKEFGQGQVTRANTEAYVWDHVEDAWRTWQARAALGKQPTQEAPADAKDAARYRWLNGPDSEWEPFDSAWLCRVDLYGGCPADMDAYIDSALQSHQEGK